MKLEEMKIRKNALGYTNERIAELSGVPLSTVQKIFAGITMKPRYDTLIALERVLYQDGQRVCEKQDEYKAESGMKKNQGEYTVEDYCALPDDCRVELIDGVLYDMAAPTWLHQRIVYELGFVLGNYIKSNKGNCFPGISPLDFHLQKDNKTMVQSDVFVLCDNEKITRRCVEGAPDLAIEVISEGNRRYDLIRKLAKYEEAGVREYWIVDPMEKKVLVYLFEDDSFPRIYGFHDQIPVHIFEGKCVIDMAEIYEEVKPFYEV